MDDKQTILVKKADGSFKHVPLSTLNKKNESKTATPEAKVAPKSAAAVAPKHRAAHVARVKSGDLKLAGQITPTKPTKLPEPIKHDLASPLEEPAPANNPAMPLVSQGRENQIESIVKSLSFKVPVENGNRLRTIIQLFLKDIRGERETMEILTRRELEGGVELSVGQAEEVIKKSEKSNLTATATSVIPVKTGIHNREQTSVDSGSRYGMTTKFDPKENVRLEKEVPDIIRKFPAPAATVILNGVKDPLTLKTGDSSLPLRMTVKSTPPPLPSTEFKINSDRAKTTMSDVKAPLEVTPTDELRYFSLVDFRRLAGNPDDAAARLKQKFINLKDESIVLFFAAIDAWRASPLYRDYLVAVSESLMKRTPLARSGDKLKIQLPEIVALLEMEKDFG